MFVFFVEPGVGGYLLRQLVAVYGDFLRCVDAKPHFVAGHAQDFHANA
jgi:hypothetical protein